MENYSMQHNNPEIGNPIAWNTGACNTKTHHTGGNNAVFDKVQDINKEVNITENTNLIFRNQLGIIYQVMMQRITKQMSAEELSFLIGRPSDYVAEVEMLKIEPYNTDDIKYIALALKDKEIRFPAPASEINNKMKITMRRAVLNGSLMHSCGINLQDGTILNYFSLHESMRTAAALEDNEHGYYVGLISDTLSVLLAAGYFYEYRLPVKIYRSINRFLKLKMNLAHVKEALYNFCNEAGKLVRVEDAAKRLRYVEL